jgi:hypothetical protein
MAYRIPRPGVLEVYTEGRRLAILVLGAFGLVVAGVLAWTAMTSGWQSEMWGAVAVTALVGGFGAFALRPEETTLTSEGIRPVQGGSVSGPLVPVLEVRMDLEVTQPINSGISRPRLDYCVDLVLDATNESGEQDTIRVFSSASEPVARQAAEEIALKMLWPLEDVIGDEVEIRSPDALNFRADRKPDPQEPPPAGITQFDRNGETVLVLAGLFSEDQRRFFPVAIGGSVASCVAAALLVTTMLSGPMLGAVIAAILIGDGLLVAGLLASNSVQSELSVQQGIVHRHFHVGPIRVHSAELDLRKVERVRVQTKDPVAQGCVLVCDDTTLCLGRGLEKPALEWLRDWVQSRLP